MYHGRIYLYNASLWSQRIAILYYALDFGSRPSPILKQNRNKHSNRAPILDKISAYTFAKVQVFLYYYNQTGAIDALSSDQNWRTEAWQGLLTLFKLLFTRYCHTRVQKCACTMCSVLLSPASSIFFIVTTYINRIVLAQQRAAMRSAKHKQTEREQKKKRKK